MTSDPETVGFAHFQVGDWRVDPGSGRMRRGDTEIKLEPKVMEVLVHLAQHPGEVVSRKSLEERAWAGTVVGYDAISGSIIKLRKALGDDPRNPRYVETISKKGYRLIAQVSAGRDNTKIADAAPSTPPKQILPAANRWKKSAAMAAGLVVLTGGLWYLVSGSGDATPPNAVVPNTPSIVVLPFKNLSDDRTQEYFSEGITDDLITDLSKLDSIRVVARQSSDYYKLNPASLQEIARQLNVAYIVEGSVRKSGSHIRINVQLTNTKKAENVWAKRFDTDTENLFKVQDDIVKNVIEAMAVTLSHRDSGRHARNTTNFEAYDAFLVGQQHARTRNKQGYELAMAAYRRAIEIDPNYARAYGAMAAAIMRGYRFSWHNLSLVEARERALELAKKAVALDQSMPPIYWALSYVHLHRQEYDAAEAAAKQSVALSSNYADGYAQLAYIANWRGRPDDAVRYISKASALNPHHTFEYASILGLAYYNLGRFDEAIATLQKATQQNESVVSPRLYLAAIYARLGKMEDASWEISQIQMADPDIVLSNLSALAPFEQTQMLTRLTEDLRKAGLPE